MWRRSHWRPPRGQSPRAGVGSPVALPSDCLPAETGHQGCPGNVPVTSLIGPPERRTDQMDSSAITDDDPAQSRPHVVRSLEGRILAGSRPTSTPTSTTESGTTRTTPQQPQSGTRTGEADQRRSPARRSASFREDPEQAPELNEVQGNSWILANETRSGAPGIFCWSASPVRVPDWGCCGVVRVVPDSVVLGLMLVGREPAKMRPSKDLTTCGRDCAGFVLASSVIGGAVLSVWSVLPVGPIDRVTGNGPRAPLVTRLWRAGSQRAAQQETLPLSRARCPRGVPGATGATPGGQRPSSGGGGVRRP